MKERPILFSAPMVRALLAGTKTQTRRIVKPQPFQDGELVGHPKLAGLFGARVLGPCLETMVGAPYGRAGDRLWVRETWYCDNYTERDFVAARVGYVTPRTDEQIVAEWRESMYYRADAVRTGTVCELIPECSCDGRSPWKPAIHMPRWASRIALEIRRVRCERLRDITEEDARAEGVSFGEMQDAIINGEPGRVAFFNARDAFAHLWAGINGPESLKANPWVWVIEFEAAP